MIKEAACSLPGNSHSRTFSGPCDVRRSACLFSPLAATGFGPFASSFVKGYSFKNPSIANSNACQRTRNKVGLLRLAGVVIFGSECTQIARQAQVKTSLYTERLPEYIGRELQCNAREDVIPCSAFVDECTGRISVCFCTGIDLSG